MKTKNITKNTENKLNTNELRYIYYISTHFLGIKRVEKHFDKKLLTFILSLGGIQFDRQVSSSENCWLIS